MCNKNGVCAASQKKKKSSKGYTANCPAVTHGLVLSFNHAWMLTYMNGGISAQGQEVS